MVTMDQIKRGIGRYVDEEIAPKLTGVKRYGVQVYTGLALQSAEKAMEEIMQHPAIRMLGLMDDNHHYDIDRLHMIALDKMQHDGRIDVDLPVVGRFTFDQSDVDKLYDVIIRA